MKGWHVPKQRYWFSNWNAIKGFHLWTLVFLSLVRQRWSDTSFGKIFFKTWLLNFVFAF